MSDARDSGRNPGEGFGATVERESAQSGADLLQALEIALPLLEASYLDHQNSANGDALFRGLEKVREAIAGARPALEPSAQLAAIQAADPEKVARAHEILDNMGDARTSYDIVHRDGEFVLRGSFAINDGKRAEGEVFRAATLDAMLDRVVEVDGRLLGAQPARQMDDRGASDAAEVNRDRHDTIAHIDSELGVVRDGTAGVVPPEPLTLEAIERDPANAVRLELPEGASRELVERVIDAASDVQERYLAAAQLAETGEARQDLQDLVERAFERQQTAEFLLGWMDHKQAADRDPAKAKLVDGILREMGDMHSHLDIAKRGDEYVVVQSFEIEDHVLAEYGLPSAELELYRATTIDALHDRLIAAEGPRPGPVREPPAVEQQRDPMTIEERAMDDGVREAERLAHGAWQAPEFSRETIAADPWTVVYLPIPAENDPELLNYARNWASDLQRYADRDSGIGALAAPLEGGPTHASEQHAEAAAARVAELDQRIELTRLPTVELDHSPLPIDTREPRGEFLSRKFVESNLAMHAARVMDLVLGTLTTTAEELWRPSPAELHDFMRARDEQAETRAFVVVDREHAAAIDEANWHVNHNRNHARTEDGARHAEDFFDRNPGLAYDAGDDAQKRENDRAFYDTGIERGR